MTPSGFDPGAFTERARHLARRLGVATRRIDDKEVLARVARSLTTGNSVELFALLTDADATVVTVAHECVMLRYAYIVAIAARAFGFDSYQRDDLVQRVFVDLPTVVARSRANGVAIPNPEGWLRRRAYLVARQMLREERGTLTAADADSVAASGIPRELVRTRGQRVGLEALDGVPSSDDEAFIRSLDGARQRERLASALKALGAEQPIGADVLRLHYQAGYPLDQVAAMLGRAYGTVRNDAQKARARLAAIIRQRYPDLVPEDDARAGQEPNDAVS